MKHYFPLSAILCVMFFTAASGTEPAPPADPLQRHIPRYYAYDSFDEAIHQIEQKTGFKVSCPDDVAKAMQGLWSRHDFSTLVQPKKGDKEMAVKELIDLICQDLSLVWSFHPETNTVALDLPWRVIDPRPASELLRLAWKDGPGIKDQAWQDTFNALLCKDINFSKALKVRQRANFENWLPMPPWYSNVPLLRTQIVSASGRRYVFLLIMHPIQMWPGHGAASHYWFNEDGTLAGAGLVNTGHRFELLHAALDKEVGAGSEVPSELHLVLQWNTRQFFIARFVLKDDGLRLIHLMDAYGKETKRNRGCGLGESLIY